jgi:hypothetical protein
MDSSRRTSDTLMELAEAENWGGEYRKGPDRQCWYLVAVVVK